MPMPTILAADNSPIRHSPPGFRPPLRRLPTRSDTVLNSSESANEESSRSGGLFSSPEDISDDSHFVGESPQDAGVEAFNRFERRINNLDKELRNFANAARQLGSSVAILSSAFRLRERLSQILLLFRQNAADLFPRKIPHVAPDTPETIDSMPRDGKRKHHRRERFAKPKAPVPAHITRPVVSGSLDLEIFPEQLEAFATDVAIFLNCLNEFPEFIDEAVNSSIRAFEGDLKYWASCLKEYTGCFRHSSVQRYIHDISSEMGEHIDSITSTFSMFIEIGVPTIRFAQQHGATNLLNLSTVATLFSAVTATTMQFSYASTQSTVAKAVNTFWFSSMVFSIAAAVNSLLGVTWKQAMYRSPAHRVPWWVLIWIKRSPLVFLVMSVTCFSLGLCCFAYASGQASITSTLTTVFTVFTSFGLAAVSAWFASERYIFLRHRGQKWLSDVLIEYGDAIQALQRAIIRLFTKNFEPIEPRLRRITRFLQSLSSRFAHFPQRSRHGDDLEAAVLPMARNGNLPNPGEPSSPAEPSATSQTPKPPRSAKSAASVSGVAGDEPSTQQSRGAELWKNAYRSVRRHTAFSSPYGMMTIVGEVRQNHRKQTSSSLEGHDDDYIRSGDDTLVMSRSRIACLRPKLHGMEPVHDIPAHSCLVRHLQFSPDGKYLATASWDRTSIIFHVANPLVSHRILAHPQGFVGQVAWSPDGKLLLTKLPRIVKIWTEDGVCQKTIDRKTAIESIAWLPDGTAFISVENNTITKVDLTGRILDQFHFGRIRLQGVAITPDSLRLISVGTLLESPTGLQPRKARPEKRLIVYNMGTHVMENQTPVLSDVRDVTVVRSSRKATVALVSYEQDPPQLWELRSFRDRETNEVSHRLTLKQTYMPRTKTAFSGSSYFGGKYNELVLCAGKAGDIYIWDQDSGILLNHIRAHEMNRDMTCLAWNRVQDNPYMFATGCHEGSIRIWTKCSEADDMNALENYDLGRNLPRSQSPFELETPYLPGTPQPQDMDSTHSRQSSIFQASRALDPRPRVPISLETAGPTGRQLFRERILAYAASQRTAEAEQPSEAS